MRTHGRFAYSQKRREADAAVRVIVHGKIAERILHLAEKLPPALRRRCSRELRPVRRFRRLRTVRFLRRGLSPIFGIQKHLFANRKLHESPYLLVVNCADEAAEKAALDIVGKSTKHCLVKAKTVNASGIELTAELRTKGGEAAFVNELTRLPGIGNATLVSYNGEYMG